MFQRQFILIVIKISVNAANSCIYISVYLVTLYPLWCDCNYIKMYIVYNGVIVY